MNYWTFKKCAQKFDLGISVYHEIIRQGQKAICIRMFILALFLFRHLSPKHPVRKTMLPLTE